MEKGQNVRKTNRNNNGWNLANCVILIIGIMFEFINFKDPVCFL